MEKEKERKEQIHFTPHKPARPMKVIKDDEGELWLCDDDVDRKKDLRGQGCLNCGEIPFTRND
ncbi:hypothetical protein ACFLU6_02140 [Acidobacteriota bacterium]